MSDGSTSAASAERVEMVRLTSQRRKDLVQKFSALAGLIVLIAIFGVTANAFFTVNNGITVALQTTSIVFLGSVKRSSSSPAASTLASARFWPWRAPEPPFWSRQAGLYPPPWVPGW